LPPGNKQAIEEEVKAIAENPATPQGGLIGIEYRYLDIIGATKESLCWSMQAFQKYGQLSKLNLIGGQSEVFAPFLRGNSTAKYPSWLHPAASQPLRCW
jgi:hypothetical protein